MAANARGTARPGWRLGLGLALGLPGFLAGCETPPEVFRDARPPELLTFRTYEGSGQVVHPDVVRIRGRRGPLWMALTPYPDQAEKWENPSIYRSRDGFGWEEPAPRVNPVASRPPFDHNCDPDLIHVDGEFRLYYLETQRREYRPDDRHFQEVRFARSRDGESWSDLATLVHWDLDRDPFYVSPCFVRAADGAWRMYVVQPKTRTIPFFPTDLDTLRAEAGRLEYDLPGVRPWHIDIFPLPKGEGWVALLCARAPGATALDTDLWIGASADLERWRFRPDPLLTGDDPALGVDIVYRSTGLVENDRLAIWYSGSTPEKKWAIGVATFEAKIVRDLLLP